MLEETRPAVRRGRMVNKAWPDKGPTNPLYADIPALKERHSRADWLATLPQAEATAAT